MANGFTHQPKRILVVFAFLAISLFLECIPQEAEAARGRRGAFGRQRQCQRCARRVNRGRGMARNNNQGQRRAARNFNDDIFGLDLEPVNVLSSLAINPFGTLQPISGFSNIVTDGSGRFFAVDNGLGRLQLQAELLRSGSGFFGAVKPFTGTFNPSISSEAFSQAQFLNTLGTLGTSCRGGFCSLR